MGRQPLTLEALELLDAIDRRGSFAKAAEELNKATSALSYGVQKLEDQLGLTVFARQGRRSVLTPAGRFMLEEGRKILAATARVTEQARELATGWEASLRVGLEWMMDPTAAFAILGDFQASHPDIELSVSETVLNGSWEALETDHLDLLLGAPGPVPAHKGFRAISLGMADLVPVISATHPRAAEIAKLDSAALSLADVQRVVTRDTATSLVARSAGLSLSRARTLQVQTGMHKLSAIRHGIGIGHLPRHQIQHDLDSGALIELSVEAANPEYFVAWNLNNRGKGLAILADLFVQQMI
ncbi:MAG: LysR substrate-binding domain-containing protein [Pseudomonadota bacterium]